MVDRIGKVEMTDYSKSSKNGKEFIKGQLSFGKFILLGVLALALSSFGPLSIFCSIPLALASLLYGRKQGLILTAVGFGILIGMASFVKGAEVFAAAYFVGAMYALSVSEVLYRNIPPARGIIYSGAFLVALIVVVIGFIQFGLGVDLAALFEQAITKIMVDFKTQNKDFFKVGGQEAKLLGDFASNPKKLAHDIWVWLPATVFAGVFLGLWICFFMILRNSIIWRQYLGYSFSSKDLVKFKVPFVFVWPLILGLVLILAEEYVGKPLSLAGGNLLYCLGVFYFFQGFGVFIDFLAHIKIRGIFRTVFVLLAITTLWRVILLVGVFDVWINFRKFFKKKNTKGDLS